MGAETTAESKLHKNEFLKENSNYLRGTIAEGLADPSTGSMSEDDQQLLKFHGTYQQDDRDLRARPPQAQAGEGLLVHDPHPRARRRRDARAVAGDGPPRDAVSPTAPSS